jgi:NAD(P)H-flavin reductase
MVQESTARVKEVIQRAYNVKSVRLDIGGKADFKAGQFLAVTLADNPALKRYLSISNSPTEQCYLEFTKKTNQQRFLKSPEPVKRRRYCQDRVSVRKIHPG